MTEWWEAIAAWKPWQRLLTGALLGLWWWVSGTAWGIIWFELLGE